MEEHGFGCAIFSSLNLRNTDYFGNNISHRLMEAPPPKRQAGARAQEAARLYKTFPVCLMLQTVTCGFFSLPAPSGLEFKKVGYDTDITQFVD